MNEIQLKIVIDNKEAIASLKLTDDNIQQLYKSFKLGTQEINGFETRLVRGFENARNVIQGVKETFSLFSVTLHKHILAYQSQETAIIKLNTALKQTGQYTETNLNSLIEYSSQLQRVTIYGDDVTQSVMAQLLAMGLSVEQTKQATLQAANLATVMGTDLNTAARAMADLFQGNIGLIGRYVKGLDETIIKSGDLNKILAMLNERIGGQAIAIGQSGVGAIARMNNAIGDLRENTGELISKALAPITSMVGDLTARLNNASPTLSSLAGLIASLTTAFVTLRVTGLMPAIKSIELFGVTLTGLKATLIKSGLGALIVGLGYAFYELSKAYEHYSSVKNAALESEIKFAEVIAQQNKQQLEWGLQDTKAAIERLELRKKELEIEKELSYEKQKKRDKEGNEFEIKIETEKTKQIKEQLSQIENQIIANKNLLGIYEQQLNSVNNTIKKKEGGKKYSELEKKQIDYELGIISKAEYQQWIEDRINAIKGATYEEKELLIQLREELEKLREVPEIPAFEIEGEMPEPEELKNVMFGDILEYARLTKEQELEIWRQKEYEKVREYENAQEMMMAIDEEYHRRKLDLIAEETNQRISATKDALSYISGAYGKHTALSKLASIAIATMNTYEAATKALTAGPIIGPILAALITAAGLSNVAKIASTPTPTGVAYERGGFALVGEKGPEIIAPVIDYAQGQAMLINAVISKINTAYDNKTLDKMISKLDDWHRSLEFKIRRGDLYASWDLENKFRKRYGD